MERDDLAWSGQSWRLPLWLGLSVAASSSTSGRHHLRIKGVFRVAIATPFSTGWVVFETARLHWLTARCWPPMMPT
jgi:hypothetical protein